MMKKTVWDETKKDALEKTYITSEKENNTDDGSF